MSLYNKQLNNLQESARVLKKFDLRHPLSIYGKPWGYNGDKASVINGTTQTTILIMN